jgi:Uma2 family endonuclease
MSDEKNNGEGDFDPVCEPDLIRIEATFHPAPGFEYLERVPLGETEAAQMENMVRIETELRPVPGTLRRFTVAEYHKLVDSGILNGDGRVELLEGFLVAKNPHSPAHDSSIQIASDAIRAAAQKGWSIRIQSAVTLSDSELDPDIAIVRGNARSYVVHHPSPAEIDALVEVADSSLLRDRSDKGRVYARAKVPVYWIINLIDRQIEVHEQPSGPTAAPAYAKMTTYQAGDSIPLVLDGNTVATFPVQDLLP